MGCELYQRAKDLEHELLISMVMGNNVFMLELFPTTQSYMDFLEWADETFLFLSLVLMVMNENDAYEVDESSEVLHVIANHLCAKYPNKGDYHAVITFMEQLLQEAMAEDAH